jgi:ABC-2 type transport system permease protein
MNIFAAGGKLAVLAAYFKIILTYRGMLIIHGLRLLLLPLVLASAWLSIEKTPGNPYSDSDYLLYYLLVPLIMNLTDSRIVFKFSLAVKDGSLNRDLLKPFPPLLGYLLESIASNAMQLVYLVPFSFAFWLFVRDRIVLTHLQPSLLVFCIIAIVIGWLARLVVSGSIALFSFWIEDVTTLNLVLNGGIWALLGGMIVPVATFPEKIRYIAGLLPYRYMLSFPIEIFSGRLSTTEIYQGFATALLWIVVFSVIMRIIWKSGLKTYTAYGG